MLRANSHLPRELKQGAKRRNQFGVTI